MSEDKYTELKVFITINDVYIFAIAEAWQSTEHIQYYQLPECKVISLQIASGIVIGVKTQYTTKVNVMHEINTNHKHEAIKVKITINNKRLNLYFICNPLTNKCDLSWLEYIRDNETLVMEDFNAHYPRWGYKGSNVTGCIVKIS